MTKVLPPPRVCPLPPDLINPCGATGPAYLAPPLSPEGRREIAAALGMPSLPPLLARQLEGGIARYRVQSRLPLVTAGQSIAAIDEALEALDAAEKSLCRFTDTVRSGVGMRTVGALNPSACEIVASIRKFRHESAARKDELRKLPRLGEAHGALGWLGSLVRFVFEAVHKADEDDETAALAHKKQLRKFTLRVFEAAGIRCGRFRWHRSRLDKFLGPVIPEPSLAAEIDIKEDDLDSRPPT
jgi:hypothetical protein